MAKSKEKKNKLTKKDVENLNVIDRSASDLVKEQISIYSRAIIMDRAVPFLEDGLKPVQRRTLYTAFKHGVLSNKKHMKCAKLAGLVLAFHPHGSASIEGVLTNLSADWKFNIPLIDIPGNNGSINGDEAAASRYIEARLTKEAEMLLTGLNKNVVEIGRNYDNTEDEPNILPSTWPVVIINGTSGIGMGMATNILPHNPNEIMDALIEIAKNQKVTDKKLKSIVKGPDFPTGGYLIKNEAFDEEFNNGCGKFINRGKVEIINEKNEKKIVIKEVPFGISIPTLIKSIADNIEDYKSILNIDEIINKTKITPEIDILFRPKATKENIETTLDLLYKKTKLEVTQSANTLVIADNRPQVLGIRTYLEKFLEFRKQTLRKEFEFDYNKLSKRLNIVNGLLKLIDISDDVIKLAKKCDGKEDLIQKLIKKFKFNEEQSEAIANMPIYRLGKQNALSLKEEKQDKETKLNELDELLNNQDTFNKKLVEVLKETKKELGDRPRKTQIISAEEAKTEEVSLDKQSLIKEQNTLVVLKQDNIIQRMSKKVYDNNINKYNNKDKIIETFDAKTTDGMLFFSENGLSIYRIVDDIENLTLKQDADNISKTVDDYKSTDQLLTGIVDTNKNSLVLTVTNKGYIKLGKVKDLIPKTKTKKYLKKAKSYIKLKDDEIVKKVFSINEKDLKNKTAVFVRNDDSEIEVPLKDLAVKGAAAGGTNKGKIGKLKTYKDFYLK